MITLARTTIAIALLLALMLFGTIIGARAQQVTQNRTSTTFREPVEIGCDRARDGGAPWVRW